MSQSSLTVSEADQQVSTSASNDAILAFSLMTRVVPAMHLSPPPKARRPFSQHLQLHTPAMSLTRACRPRSICTDLL